MSWFAGRHRSRGGRRVGSLLRTIEILETRALLALGSLPRRVHPSMQ